MVMDYLGMSIPDYSGLDFSQYAPQMPPAATPEPAPQVSQTSGALDAASFSPSNLRAVMLANPSITIDELAKGFGVSVDDVSNALSLNPANWDKSVSDYYNQLGEYRKQMEDQGFFLLDPRQQGGYFDPKTGYFVNTSFIPEAGVSIPSMYGPANQDYYRGMMGEYPDPSKFYQTVMMYKSPTGKGESEYFGSVVADPNKQYRLVDTNTGQVAYSGTGLEALKEINRLVPSLSTKPSESWSLDVAEPGADPNDFTSKSWQPSGVQKINTDTPGFMKALGTLLPIATAFIPGLNVLGTIATQAASGAIGAGMAGRDPLTGALIGGATAGLMKAPILSGGQSISGALGQAVGAGGTGALEAAAGALPGEIIVTAAPKIFEQAVNAAAQGGVGALTSGLIDKSTQQAIDQYAGQTPATISPTVDLTLPTAPTAGALPSAGIGANVPEIVVTAPTSTAAAQAAANAATGSAGALGQVALDQATQQAIDQYVNQVQQPTLEQQFDETFGAGTSQAPAGGLAAVDPLTGELTVTAGGVPGIGAGNLANAVGPALGALSGVSGVDRLQQIAETKPEPVPEYVDTTPITVSSQPPALDLTGPAPVVTIPSGALSSIENIAPQITEQPQQAPEYVDTKPIEVVAEPKPLDLTGPAPVVTIPSGALTEIGSTIPQLPTPEVTPAEEIVVKGKPETQPTPTPVIPPATTTTTTPPTETKAEAKTEAETPKEKSTLDKIIDYIQIAGLGTGLIGDLLSSGGGSGALGTIPAGLFGTGTGTSVFNKPLPAPNLPGLGVGGTGIGARTAADLTATTGLPTPGSGASNIDWYRYGYGPEQSFFKQVPQGAKNVSQAFTGYEVPFKGLQNMAEGGYAVGGPGDGRDDKIPAMLSDGEYVMDAETVAMLGNGSSKAGADALDRFRVNIRKHKGRSMARGNFSVKAKKPEKYLKKDRA